MEGYWWHADQRQNVIFMFLIIHFIGLFNNGRFGNMWDEVERYIYIYREREREREIFKFMYSMRMLCNAFESRLTPTNKPAR